MLLGRLVSLNLRVQLVHLERRKQAGDPVLRTSATGQVVLLELQVLLVQLKSGVIVGLLARFELVESQVFKG